jgi:phage tail-like protein
MTEPVGANRFTVEWDGQRIDGVHRVGPLVINQQGASTSCLPVTIERRPGRDPAFETWATHALQPVATGAQADAQRKTVVVTVLDPAGNPAIGFRLDGCLPVAYSPLSQLDADAGLLAVETLTLTVQRITRQPF